MTVQCGLYTIQLQGSLSRVPKLETYGRTSDEER